MRFEHNTGWREVHERLSLFIACDYSESPSYDISLLYCCPSQNFRTGYENATTIKLQFYYRRNNPTPSAAPSRNTSEVLTVFNHFKSLKGRWTPSKTVLDISPHDLTLASFKRLATKLGDTTTLGSITRHIPYEGPQPSQRSFQESKSRELLLERDDMAMKSLLVKNNKVPVQGLFRTRLAE